jgi:uncharacterized damage-inducible protein DinB
MAGRTHKERLIKDLNEIRGELRKELALVKPENFEWAPEPSMKSYKALLLEIGTMEKLCAGWMADKKMEGWGEAETSLGWDGTDVESLLASLEKVREKTLAYLESCTEEQLQTPIDMPVEWHQYMGPTVEPEELVRWICRHEYYHLGQVVSYLWIQGHNPYAQNG